MPKTKSPPSYRLHKARDCAVVTINGTAINTQLFDTFLQAVTGKPAAEATKEAVACLASAVKSFTRDLRRVRKDVLCSARRAVWRMLFWLALMLAM